MDKKDWRLFHIAIIFKMIPLALIIIDGCFADKGEPIPLWLRIWLLAAGGFFICVYLHVSSKSLKPDFEKYKKLRDEYNKEKENGKTT